MKLPTYLKLIIAVGISELAGVVGALFTTPQIEGWYSTLVKPSWNPPAWVFGPVWTVLFALIGVALFLVWQQNWRVARPLIGWAGKAWNGWSERLWRGDLQQFNIIALFGLQYMLNIAWSVVFFGLHAPGAAFFVLCALWCAIVYLIINFYRVSTWAAWLLVPYLAWVTFAGILNLAVWMLNP